ncbi:MAG: LptE family protein [Flavobacteriales bacterium]|nr:LptE family protein [Flavobacteriales bacterium]
MRIAFSFIIIVLVHTGCKMNYGFSGASIDYNEVKTYSVKFFPNYAPLAQPTLSQEFTEELRDVFLNQTKLDLVKANGDLQFSGKITDYNTTPVSITANEVAAQNRLTITVQVTFVNTKDETKNFEQTFSKYADYSSTEALSSVESSLIEEINKLLVQEIFNKSVSNW